MITFLRKIFSTVVGKILALVILVVIAGSFGLSGVSGGGTFGGVTGTEVAVVGDTAIGTGDLQQRVRRNHERLRASQPLLTLEAYIAAGGIESSLQSMIEESAYEQYARQRGFATTKRLVDGRIVDTPSFEGLTGKFDKELFEQVLQQQGLTEREVRTEIQRALLYQQLAQPLQDIGAVSQGFAELYTILATEQRIGRSVVVAAQRFAPRRQPSDEVLAKYLEENKVRFSLPERRTVRYAIFDRNVVQAEPPTAEEIAANYEANQSAYQASEKRRFEQVIAQSQQAADAIRSAASNSDLNSAAVQVGLSASETSPLSQSEFAALTSEEIAAAAFAAPRGALLDPMQVPLGWLVVRVSDIERVPARSLAEATPDIRRTLAADKANAALVAFYNGIQDAVNAGASIAEIASDNGLRLVETPPLLSDGSSPDRPRYRLPSRARPLVAQAFALAAEAETQLVDIVSNELFALYDVQQIHPPAPPPLARIRSQLIVAWNRAEGQKAARKEAEAILAATQEGKSLTQAIRGRRAELPQPVRIPRSEVLRLGTQAPAEIITFFGMSVGEVEMIAIPNDIGWMILSLDEVRVPDSDEIPVEVTQQIREIMTNNIKNELLALLIAEAKNQVGYEIDQPTLDRLHRDMTSANLDGF